ncbi:MAG TPA: protein kinase [Gammaproteobacteria bacterium]|nr:protein kinase [Gammaproteobacteria bacterium]
MQSINQRDDKAESEKKNDSMRTQNSMPDAVSLLAKKVESPPNTPSQQRYDDKKRTREQELILEYRLIINTIAATIRNNNSVFNISLQGAKPFQLNYDRFQEWIQNNWNEKKHVNLIKIMVRHSENLLYDFPTRMHFTKCVQFLLNMKKYVQFLCLPDVNRPASARAQGSVRGRDFDEKIKDADYPQVRPSSKESDDKKSKESKNVASISRYEEKQKSRQKDKKKSHNLPIPRPILLKTFLNSKTPEEFSWFERLRIAIDIVKKLKDLDAKGEFYGMLKSKYILMDVNGRVSLPVLQGKYKSPSWRKDYSIKTDIRDFGNLLLELVWFNIEKDVLHRPVWPPDCPAEIRALINKCLARNITLTEIEQQLWKIFDGLVAQPVLSYSKEHHLLEISFPSKVQQQKSKFVLQQGRDKVPLDAKVLEKMREKTKELGEKFYRAVVQDPRCVLTFDEEEKAKSLYFYAPEITVGNQQNVILLISSKEVIDAIFTLFKLSEEIFVRKEENGVHFISIRSDLLSRFTDLIYQNAKNNCELTLNIESALEFMPTVIVELITDLHRCSDNYQDFNEPVCLSSHDIAKENQRYIEAIKSMVDLDQKDSSLVFEQIKALSQDPKILTYLLKMIENTHLERDLKSWIIQFLLSILKTKGIIAAPLAGLYVECSQFNILKACPSDPDHLYIAEGKNKKSGDEKVLIKVWKADGSCKWERNTSVGIALQSILGVLAPQQLGMFYDAWSFKHVFAVYPYRPKNLLEAIREDKIPNKLSWKDRLQIGIDLARAVKGVHSRNVLCGNIRPDIILLDENNRAEIYDFSESRRKPQWDAEKFEEVTQLGHITGRIMPPEISLGHTPDQSSDVYNIGVVLFYLFTSLSDKPKLSKLDALFLPGFPLAVAMKALILDCINIDRSKRPAISEVLHRLEQIFLECEESFKAGTFNHFEGNEAQPQPIIKEKKLSSARQKEKPAKPPTDFFNQPLNLDILETIKNILASMIAAGEVKIRGIKMLDSQNTVAKLQQWILANLKADQYEKLIEILVGQIDNLAASPKNHFLLEKLQAYKKTHEFLLKNCPFKELSRQDEGYCAIM